jgi:hypothetical protein
VHPQPMAMRGQGSLIVIDDRAPESHN